MVNEDYNKEVLNEGGYIVELSNEGELKKHNPNFYNPEKKKLKCAAVWKKDKQTKELEPIECNNLTSAPYQLCSKHNVLASYPLHTKDWFGRTILPNKNRNECKTFALPHSQISRGLIGWIGKDELRGKKIDLFVDDILYKIHGKIPDASILQHINLGDKSSGAISPDDLVKITISLVNKHFPKNEYDKILLEGGKFKGMEINKIPLRIVAANLVLAFACEESNRGDSWGTKKTGLKPRYANMFMPLALYLLMRKGATEGEAKMSVKSS